MTTTVQPLAFLELLFEGTEGLIEVRLIEDKRNGAVVERRWYPTPSALVEDLDRLLKVAEMRSAAVFFGVLPRRERGRGTAEDSSAAHVVWADLDFKDFEGGGEETRGVLAAFPIQPSIVVASGHGLHAYFLLRESEPPERLSALSKRLARALGGDHTFDPARVLRLPGTLNRKDPANPLPVVVEVFEPERRYSASEIEETLEMVEGDAPGAPADESGKAAAGASGSEGPAISPEAFGPIMEAVFARIDADRRLRGLFEGTGKPEFGRDGRRLDQTSSGYDYSLALAMKKRGFSPDEIANMIWNRPDDAARCKGPDYIRRTIERAMERGAAIQSAKEKAALDFQVERVRVHASDRSTYELAVGGQEKVLRLKTSELRSKSRFVDRFLDLYHRIPILPRKGGDWAELVNGWLARAEVVELPEDASDEHALREAVGEAAEDLPVGEEAKDLDEGKALVEGGVRHFKTKAVRQVLREEWPDLKRDELCRVLRVHGYVYGSGRLLGKQVSTWSRP